LVVIGIVLVFNIIAYMNKKKRNEVGEKLIDDFIEKG